MIRMYCRRHHHCRYELCDECRALSQYAERRVEKCPYGSEKPTCMNCTTHCYTSVMREKIRRAMRFAGPRMILRHPWLAVMHVFDGWRERQIKADGIVKKQNLEIPGTER